MLERLKQIMANKYFNWRMRKIFVDRGLGIEVETFSKYLSYRYQDNCYYYSGYAIIGLNNEDYLVRGNLNISGDFFRGKMKYPHGWVEFKFMGSEFVFDSMYREILPKYEWYKTFLPEVKLKLSLKEVMESFDGKLKKVSKNCYEIRGCKIFDYYTDNVYRYGKLFIQGKRIKAFIAYDEPSG